MSFVFGVSSALAVQLLVREFSVMCLVSSLVLVLASPALAGGRADSKAEIRKAVIGTTIATFFVTEVMKSLTHDLIITVVSREVV